LGQKTRGAGANLLLFPFFLGLPEVKNLNSAPIRRILRLSRVLSCDFRRAGTLVLVPGIAWRLRSECFNQSLNPLKWLSHGSFILPFQLVRLLTSRALSLDKISVYQKRLPDHWSAGGWPAHKSQIPN
jgi:hypothetical protein